VHVIDVMNIHSISLCDLNVDFI